MAEAVSIEGQIACVRRELAMRKNVYGKWVKGGRMKQEAADKEIAAMQAVHDTLTNSQARDPSSMAHLWVGDCGHVWRKDQAANCPICALAQMQQSTVPLMGKIAP